MLHDTWSNLREVARRLGLAVPSADYDPAVYLRVYEALLRHRNVEIIPLDVILPTETMSVYDFAVTPPNLAPIEAETEAFIEMVERRYTDPSAVEGETERWWEV